MSARTIFIDKEVQRNILANTRPLQPIPNFRNASQSAGNGIFKIFAPRVVATLPTPNITPKLVAKPGSIDSYESLGNYQGVDLNSGANLCLELNKRINALENTNFWVSMQ